MKYAYVIGALVVLLAVAGYVLLYGEKPVPPPPPTPELPTAATPPATATYYCTGDRTMQATFLESSVKLLLSDGRTFELPKVPSGAGAHYENPKTAYGTDVALIVLGDNAFLTENSKATYEDCTAAIVVESDAPGYATYTDPEKTFTFAFPTNFHVAGSAIGGTWSMLEGRAAGTPLARLMVPSSLEAGTNFIDASFTVGTSATQDSISHCLTLPSGGTATGTVASTKIGEVPAATLKLKYAAAGNRYDTTSYRALHNNQCYAVEYTIHYGNIDNYPKGSVKEFDEAALTSSLDEVARSFRFLK